MILARPPGLADLGDLHLGYCTNIHAGENSKYTHPSPPSFPGLSAPGATGVPLKVAK
jgi:hypothetical protein